MTDYSERGAAPVEDAAVDDPPTVEEVAARQREMKAREREQASPGASVDDADAEEAIEPNEPA